MGKKSYKKTEKWWLGLTILFYALYNVPGFPAYGDSDSAIIHGALTIIPLWIISYGGMFVLNRQRKLKKIVDVSKQEESCSARTELASKGGI